MRAVNSSPGAASCQLVGRSSATTRTCLASSSARSLRQSSRSSATGGRLARRAVRRRAWSRPAVGKARAGPASRRFRSRHTFRRSEAALRGESLDLLSGAARVLFVGRGSEIGSGVHGGNHSVRFGWFPFISLFWIVKRYLMNQIWRFRRSIPYLNQPCGSGMAGTLMGLTQNPGYPPPMLSSDRRTTPASPLGRSAMTFNK